MTQHMISVLGMNNKSLNIRCECLHAQNGEWMRKQNEGWGDLQTQ